MEDDATMQEIEKELHILKTELISHEELGLVKNYMLGALLGSLENVFSHADKFKNVYFSDLDFEYYDRYTQVVRTITDKEILDNERFTNLGVVTNYPKKSKENLQLVLTQIDNLFKTDNITKTDIIETIKKIIPNFNHITTGKSLDNRM